MQLTVLRDVAGLQSHLAGLAGQGRRIALVPTMGALHKGHAALIEHAKKLADVVAVSIFVNPKQFGAGEDFSKYPRQLEADIKVASEAGAALVYAPTAEDMYPAGFATTISVGELGNILEGAARPKHFDGVATVVAKLLLRALPHVAIFGEKDYQQLCVIRRLVRDLDIPIEIIGHPTVREADGLAMSSRNAYLSAAERKTAPTLYKTLTQTAEKIKAGDKAALKEGIKTLEKAGFTVDYLELCHAASLAEMKEYAAPARLLVAATLGNTRLIDNIAVE